MRRLAILGATHDFHALVGHELATGAAGIGGDLRNVEAPTRHHH